MEGHFVLSSAARELSFASKSKSGTQRLASAESHRFEVRAVVDKDVKLQFYKHDAKEKKEKANRIFHVWFNTHFANEKVLVFTLADNDIDGIKKTKKMFPPSFAVEFHFEDEANI